MLFLLIVPLVLYFHTSWLYLCNYSGVGVVQLAIFFTMSCNHVYTAHCLFSKNFTIVKNQVERQKMFSNAVFNSF